jgi:hypothetical protein
MILISHRVNSVELLNKVPHRFGIEIDIRSIGRDLILQHDPYERGELLATWLESYQHKTLILNVKEEGLESELIKLMNSKGINDFFFLDQSFPFLVKWSKLGEIRCAVRISEFESINTALKLSRKIGWVWVDCFNHFPLNKNDALKLKDAGFKLCLVSPELHEVKADEVIKQFIVSIRENAINPDAVCTKRPDLWETYFL